MSNVTVIKQPLSRKGLTSADIISYDDDNLYPQKVWWLIAASKTAIKAAGKMAENIECDGFTNQAIGMHKNAHRQTLNEILSLISFDMARFNGAYLLIQYNALGQAVNVYHIPFEYVRIKANEDYKMDSKVRAYKVFNNWEKASDLNTDVQDAKEYNAYNPESVLAEIEEAGGIENYAGQLYEISMIKYKGYPLSPFHAVRDEMEIERQNSMFLKRKFSNGFMDCSVIEYQSFDGANDEESSNNQAFEQGLKSMTSAENAASFVTVTRDMFADNTPLIRKIDLSTPIDKDLYKAFTEPLKKDICGAAENLPIGLIDSTMIQAGMSSGGDIIKELRKMYRESLLRYRNKISESLAIIFGSDYATFAIDDKLNQVQDDNNNTESQGGI